MSACDDKYQTHPSLKYYPYHGGYPDIPREQRRVSLNGPFGRCLAEVLIDDGAGDDKTLAMCRERFDNERFFGHDFAHPLPKG